MVPSWIIANHFFLEYRLTNSLFDKTGHFVIPRCLICVLEATVVCQDTYLLNQYPVLCNHKVTHGRHLLASMLPILTFAMIFMR